MADEAKIPDRRYKAADDTLSDMLKFSPISYWKTFVAILSVARRDHSVLAEAISQQSWQNVLPPFKFLLASFAIFGVFAVYALKVDKKELASTVLSMEMFLAYLIVAACFVPFRFLLLRNSKSERVFGTVDGMAKLLQMEFFFNGLMIVVAIPLLVVSSMVERNAVAADWVAIPMFALIGVCCWLGFTIVPRLIGYVFEVSFRRALVTWVGVVLASALVSSFLTEPAAESGHPPTERVADPT